MPDTIRDLGALARSLAWEGGLLSRATADDLRAIAPSLRRRRFGRGDVLIEAGTPAPLAYFVERGVASVIRPAAGDRATEICLIGPEGFVGSSIVMGEGRSPYRTLVQCDQLNAFAVEASALRALFDRSTSFRRLILSAIEAQTVQISETLVATLWHQIQARLARWLLMYRERLGSDRLEITHEFISLMIGAQRPKVTATVHELEGAGAITATRGLIVIRDAGLLEKLAGGSYVDRGRTGQPITAETVAASHG